MDVELTKSAQKSLALLYTEYKKRIKAGETKQAAATFCDPFQRNIYREIKQDEKELVTAGLVTAHVREVTLSSKGILYMETATKEKRKKWMNGAYNFLSKFIKPF